MSGNFVNLVEKENINFPLYQMSSEEINLLFLKICIKEVTCGTKATWEKVIEGVLSRTGMIRNSLVLGTRFHRFVLSQCLSTFYNRGCLIIEIILYSAK